MLDETTIKTLFLFIFLLLGKHIKPLISCSLTNIINKHIIARHIIGLAILYTTLISFETTQPLGDLFIKSIIIYIWFIIATKTPTEINILLCIILFMSYFLYLYKKREKINKNSNFSKLINLYEKYVTYIFGFLCIFGFIIYIGEKKIEYQNDFNWNTFLLGTLSCNNMKENMIDSLNYFEKINIAFTK